MKGLRLALIPGDGIGRETVAAGKKVLDAASPGRRFSTPRPRCTEGSVSGTSSSTGAANITRSTDG
jgi:isocitrate/isopropylmalate dehydrogenase